MRRQRVFSPLGVLALGAWLLSAWSPPAAAAPNAPGSIKIAVEAPLSGPQGGTGPDILRGAELLAAIEDHNGGVLGRQLKVIRANDDADPAKAASVAKEVIAEHALAVIGPFDSSVGVINLPMYKAAGVIPLRLTSSHATNGLGYTVAPMDYQVAPVEAQAIAASLPRGGGVAIVYDSSTFTSGIAQLVRSSLASRGIPVVAFDSYTAGQRDFSALLSGVKAANPSVVYYAAYHPQASELVSQAKSLGVPGTCFVDLAPEGFIQSVGVSLARTCVFSGVPDVSEFPGRRGSSRTTRPSTTVSPGRGPRSATTPWAFSSTPCNGPEAGDPSRVNDAIDHTVAFSGVTGDITIDPATGNRVDAPVVILGVSRAGTYQVDPAWALYGTLVKAPST